MSKNLSYHPLCNSVSPFFILVLSSLRQTGPALTNISSRFWQILLGWFDKSVGRDIMVGQVWRLPLSWPGHGQFDFRTIPLLLIWSKLIWWKWHSSFLIWFEEVHIIRLVDSHRVQANEKEGKNYFCKSHLCALFWWDKTQTNPSQPNRNANVFTNVGKSGQRLMLGVVMVVDQLDN